jgi:hypothetical protein
MRKKKMIWWEQDAEVSGAEEARRRGAPEGSGRRRAPDAYYGPITLEADDDPAGPDSVGTDAR